MRKLCKCNIQNCCHIAYAASEFTPLRGTVWGNGGAVTANYQHTHFTLAMKRWRVWRNYKVGLEGRQLIKRWQPDPDSGPELRLKVVGGPIAKSICQLVYCQGTYEAWKRVIRVEALTARSCEVHCSACTTSFATTIPTTTSTTTTMTTNTYITTSTTSTLLPPLVLLLHLLFLLQLARFELLGCSHHFQPSLPPLGKHLWPEPTQTRLKREPSCLFQPVWTKSIFLNDPKQQVLPRPGDHPCKCQDFV